MLKNLKFLNFVAGRTKLEADMMTSSAVARARGGVMTGQRWDEDNRQPLLRGIKTCLSYLLQLTHMNYIKFFAATSYH